MVGDEDLQLLCKNCHSIKTLAEKKGISFKEAEAEKQVIAICKLKVVEQNKWLAERGIVATNAKDRRQAIKEELMRE